MTAEHVITVSAPADDGDRRWTISVDGNPPVPITGLRQVRYTADELGGAVVQWPADIAERLAAIEAADEAITAAQEQSVRARRAVIEHLRHEYGVTPFADLGAVMGVSKQRAQKIATAPFHARDKQAPAVGLPIKTPLLNQ